MEVSAGIRELGEAYSCILVRGFGEGAAAGQPACWPRARQAADAGPDV